MINASHRVCAEVALLGRKAQCVGRSSSKKGMPPLGADLLCAHFEMKCWVRPARRSYLRQQFSIRIELDIPAHSLEWAASYTVT